MKLGQLALLWARCVCNCDDHVHECNSTISQKHNLIPVLSLSARLTIDSCWQIEDISQCCRFYWLHGYKMVHVLDVEWIPIGFAVDLCAVLFVHWSWIFASLTTISSLLTSAFFMAAVLSVFPNNIEITLFGRSNVAAVTSGEKVRLGKVHLIWQGRMKILRGMATKMFRHPKGGLWKK